NEHGSAMDNMEGHARSAWAKLEGYAARFALIFHCVRQATGAKELDYVDEEDVRAGIELARWFGIETLRVYRQMHECDEDRQRRELLEWIAGRGGRVTARDLQRGPQRYREHLGQAEADLQALVDNGDGSWAIKRPGAAGGKPTHVFCMAESPDFPICR